jgi:hypothetical protein
MTTTPITPERPPPEFNSWTEVWDEHQLRGTQLRTAATTIASLRAENERLTTLLAAAQAECEAWRVWWNVPDGQGGDEIDARRAVKGARSKHDAVRNKYDAARRKVQG